LEMARTGLFVRGKDTVTAENKDNRAKFDTWKANHKKSKIPFAARFHIAPDVALELGMRDTAVTMTTPKGEVWLLRAPKAQMSIEKSAYMEYGRLNPRAANQVVVSSVAINYEGVIEWSLTRLEA